MLTRHLPGLHAPVTLHRDPQGVPHLRAGTAHDAWFALGAVHAEDRLFQMQLTRRRGTGHAAEWLGAAAVAQDTLHRRLHIEHTCRRDLAALGEDALHMLNAYAAGVNAWIASNPAPAEYALLETTPDRCEPWHAIAVMRRTGLLMGSLWPKLWRAAALPIVGAEQVTKLRHDDAGADLLILPPGTTAERWTATLAELAPAIAALLQTAAPDASGGGSNNWVLSGAHTDTGRPILAGDPHRVFEIPNMYAQTHLACDTFDAIGLTVPGVPGFPHFAHNGHVAWCVTHAFVDIHDLYVERFSPDARATLFQGAWEPVRTRAETIAVRNAHAIEVETLTTRHGPIIAGDPRTGHALALRSVQTDATDRSFDCLPPMLSARTVAELFEATRGWALIDHNLVAADTAGHIGHLLRAEVPVRPRSNGWLPVPGWTGEHEWQGMIPWDRMPRVIDPPGGTITTANNRVVADTHPDYLCTDCHPPYRAQRIAALLAAGGSRTPAAAAAIHADTLSPHATLFQASLPALPPHRLRERILAWDGRMDARSTGATAYIALRRALTTILAERSGLGVLATHPLLAPPPGVTPMTQLWWCLPTLLRNDDTALLRGLTWDDALREALSRAEPADTTWGEAHRPGLAHPLAALFPDHPVTKAPPAPPLGGDGDTVFATGMAPGAGTAATYGALARYAFDVGDWDNSLWSVFHGASGRAGDRHYADQTHAWAQCAMVPMRYAWPTIEREATATVTLAP